MRSSENATAIRTEVLYASSGLSLHDLEHESLVESKATGLSIPSNIHSILAAPKDRLKRSGRQRNKKTHLNGALTWRQRSDKRSAAMQQAEDVIMNCSLFHDSNRQVRLATARTSVDGQSAFSQIAVAAPRRTKQFQYRLPQL